MFGLLSAGYISGMGVAVTRMLMSLANYRHLGSLMDFLPSTFVGARLSNKCFFHVVGRAVIAIDNVAGNSEAVF